MSSKASEKPPDAERSKRLRRRVTILLIGLPLLIATFTLTGTLAGLYLSGVLKSGELILPLALSLVGLFCAIFLSYRITSRASGNV